MLKTTIIKVIYLYNRNILLNLKMWESLICTFKFYMKIYILSSFLVV